MFTGIVKEIGAINRIERRGGAVSITVSSGEVARGLTIGDSVAINGVCLTAVKISARAITFDVMEETIRRSTLAYLKEGDIVNVEGSMKADGVFGGHFVQGHIDCVGAIRGIGKSGGNFSMDVEVPDGFGGLYVDKGSIAIDGVSLTIGECKNNGFNLYLIPHTLGSSTLGKRKAGDKVNVEFDILGKYALKAQGRKEGVTEKFLEDKGFH